MRKGFQVGTKLWKKWEQNYGKKEELEFAWKFKQTYNLNYKHVCTCQTSKKKSDTHSLGFLNKSI